MLKKTVLAIATGIICSLSVPVIYAHEHEKENVVEHKMINTLRYYKTMYEATPDTEFMRIAFGSKPENVGSYQQDKRHMSYGFPMAFRPTKNPDEAWLLDSINDSLKLFKSGKLIRKVDLSRMGFVTDFAMNSIGEMAFLNASKGTIYITDKDGKIKNTFSGFESALYMEFASDKDLLIKSPLSKGVVRISIENGAVLGVYEGDQSISCYSSAKGIWGIKASGGTIAKLFVRTTNFTFDNPETIIAEFPLKAYEGVEYKGGEIYGFDAEGNIYFGLIACDMNGIIFRDRIYKCDQNGKVLKEMDVLAKPVMSPGIPRHKIACPDGRIMTFFSDELKYFYLNMYTLK